MDNYLRAKISVSAIRHNIDLVRGVIGDGVMLCAVVKANAYGLGVRQVMGVIGSAADMLAVVTCTEAIELRQLGWQRPVMMFITAGASDAGTAAELIAEDITLTLTSLAEMPLLVEAAEKAHRPADVFIKIDTGMNRNGVLPDEAPQLAAAARESESVRLAGMYTHFACANMEDKSFAREQLERFMRTVDRCGGRAGLILHAANSAGTIDLPESHLDMVRTGLALYGYRPSDRTPNAPALKPSLRLTGPIVLTKNVPAGAGTGYGMTYTFDSDARVALVPVGYADGYDRGLSDKASMRVHGVDCPVRGHISMDQAVIDVTGVPKARVGDEVEIISPDPDAPNSVENLARLAGTIPYEILSRLGNRIRREIVD